MSPLTYKVLNIYSFIRCETYNSHLHTTTFGCLISSCGSLFKSYFTNSRAKFARRQTNVVAHALPGKTVCLASPSFYFNIHGCVETIVINEMI